jgi:Glucosamine 6-phosphate synthetase, contains amidotransferase and phosphosugar isomerase domains
VAIPSLEFAALPKSDFYSDETELLAELAEASPEKAENLHLLDTILVWIKRRTIAGYVDQFRTTLFNAQAAGGRIYLVASGSSYHAALTAAYFFNILAHVPVYSCNPGIFRSMYLASLKDADVLIGISQSGETKDLVDVFVEVKENSPRLRVPVSSTTKTQGFPESCLIFTCPCSAVPK